VTAGQRHALLPIALLTRRRHRSPESPGDREYLDLVFTVSHWSGIPSIGEPDKCSELVWADPDNLPGDTIGYIATALRTLRRGEPLLIYGWNLCGPPVGAS
jgi:8-oxo-dGTP diphosphatase